mmetsp:Transcript_2683/g.6002  ORF Transcript_2683/g.6002 Transcript_2683/m.6002 type:complete len:804 (-) Transcript_2683:561-2972(-)
MHPNRPSHRAVLVSCGLHLVPPLHHRIPIVHLRIARLSRAGEAVDLVVEDRVDEERERPRPHARVRERLLHELDLVCQLKDRSVRYVELEVRILVAVAGEGEGEAHAVGRVVLDGPAERLEVARRLGHLLAVELEVAVGADALGPLLLREDGAVVVQEEREVVLDQVLARHAQVDGVPVRELLLHAVEGLLGDGSVLREGLLEHHVVEHLLRQILSSDVALARDRAVEGPRLQDVREGVVRHVDRRVGERLDHELLVPGEQRPEAEGAGAAPLAEPAERNVEPRLCVFRVVVHAPGRDMLRDLRPPSLLAVLNVPLVGKGNDALVARARHDLLLRLRVDVREVLGQHLRLDLRLGILDRHTLAVPDGELPLVEPELVTLRLGEQERRLVVLRGHLVLLACHHGGDVGDDRLGALLGIVALVRDRDNRDDLERQHPLVLDAVLLAERGLLLEVHERDVVIRRVRGHRRHHTRALLHGDGEHRERVDALQGGQRGLQRDPHHVAPLHPQHQVGDAKLGGEALVGHVHCRPLGHDCDLARGARLVTPVVHLGAVLLMWEHPAVGLPVHGLRTEGRGQHHHLLPLQRLHRRGELQHLHLDEDILLGPDALARRAVVIRADLLVARREHRVPLPKRHLLELLELEELPLDEGIVVGVHRRRDERPPPIHLDAHLLEVILRKRREVLQPEVRIHKLRDNLALDVHRLQDLPLRALALLALRLGLLADELCQVRHRPLRLRVRACLGLSLGGGLGLLLLLAQRRLPLCILLLGAHALVLLGRGRGLDLARKLQQHVGVLSRASEGVRGPG